jgi:hypothetical protein
MNLLDAIQNRGDIPSKNVPQQMPMPPGRGTMPGPNPFGGQQKNMLAELMQLFQQRQGLAQSMSQRHAQVPTAGARSR